MIPLPTLHTWSFLIKYYTLGGFLCGLIISILYVVCFVRGLNRLPWSRTLGLGWLTAVPGIALSIVLEPLNGTWRQNQEVVGAGCCAVFGLGLWWVSAVSFWITRQNRRLILKGDLREEILDDESVWPPPPAK